MGVIDILSITFDNMGRRKGRVAMTAVGVVIGTAAIMVLVSLAAGLQRSVTAQFSGMADLTLIQVMPNYEVVYASGPGPGGGGGGGEIPDIKLLTTQTLAEIGTLDHILGVYPRDYLMMNIAKLDQMEGYPNVLGIEPGMLADLGYQPAQGSLDLERGTAVVGAMVWQSFYDPRPRPGAEQLQSSDFMDQTLRFIQGKWNEQEGTEITRELRVKVIGVLPEMRGEADYTVYVLLSDVDQWNGWVFGRPVNRQKDGFQQAAVIVDDLKNVLKVTDQISELGFQAYSPQSYIQGTTSFFTLLQLAFGGIGMVALLVAAIGIVNTMTMAILERTREIGLMKAVGATHRDVMSIFISEAAFIGLSGGGLGLIVGWAAGQVINFFGLLYLASQPAEAGMSTPLLSVYTPEWLPWLSLALATLVGALSGVYPALKAATLEPVAALKVE